MSRSFKKAKNHRGRCLGGRSIYAKGKYAELRSPRQHLQALRELQSSNEDGEPPFRKGSIPPSPNEDRFATGRIGDDDE